MKVATDHPAAEPVPESEHVFAFTRAFAGLPESVREARSWVAGFFTAPAASDAALMASELFTNAITYSASGLPGGSVTVKVAPWGDHGGDRRGKDQGDDRHLDRLRQFAAETEIRVDVIDQGALPAAAPCGLGKGLAIVAQLADVFGAEGPDRWFALRTGGAR